MATATTSVLAPRPASSLGLARHRRTETDDADPDASVLERLDQCFELGVRHRIGELGVGEVEVQDSVALERTEVPR